MKTLNLLINAVKIFLRLSHVTSRFIDVEEFGALATKRMSLKRSWDYLTYFPFKPYHATLQYFHV